MRWIPLLTLAGLALLAGCGDQGSATGEGTPPAENTTAGANAPGEGNPNAGPPASPATVDAKEYKTLDGGLKYAVLKPGTGPVANEGQHVMVNYTGWLSDRKTMFDSSLKPGRGPFDFTLGQHQVIDGWDQGVKGMKVGEKRQLVVPPDLAYGDHPPGSEIPPGATLIFDVELLGVQ